MRKVSEYRQNAVECRKLAARTDDMEQQKLLMEMAEDWEGLAEDRAALIRKYPEPANPGGSQEAGRRSGHG